MNLHDLFAIPLAEAPARAALRFREADGRTTAFSYAELFAAAERTAAGLAACGLGRGDRIAFFLGNRPELVIAYLAAIRLGAIVVPINLAYRKVELGH
ncbi:MAG TPA: class I adenylate-forming enzyme family protein, partial [Thermoanaerobaculia bacterium]|nr:class I adenylate-forming enzyme family protein [Thermoanaerobaculia bacterium]